MIEILTKPADWIELRDIESLIQSKVPEGEQIEFKKELPAKGNLLIHESPLTDALFLLVSKSDEVTTT